MPKIAPELTALHIRRLAKRPGFHAVGGVAGLHLDVKATLAASWILRKQVGSRRVDIGLGGFPAVTLDTARDKARLMHEQATAGIDPVAARREAQAALRAAQAKSKTFDEVAKLCHAKMSAEFKNAKHKAQWLSTLDTYASPIVGSLPVASVEVPHLLDVLTPIWSSKTETATRVRQRIEAVLAFAITHGYRPAGPNPAAWEGNLEHALPKAQKVKRVKHHPAIPWQDVGEFAVKLRGHEGSGPRALEFAILTAARSGEVRFARWDEIDLAAKLWTVPPERMKAGKVHHVPLSDRAVELLQALPRLRGCDYVFPSKGCKPLSDSALSKLMRDMGAPGVPHGFRSSFKDWARSSTAYPDEVSELALAHVNSDATRAAYARDGLLPKRKAMMAAWAKHLSVVRKKATVTPLRARQ